MYNRPIDFVQKYDSTVVNSVFGKNHSTFYGFIWDNLKIPSVKCSKLFTPHRVQRNKNFKREKVGVVRQVFRFLQIYVFNRYEKTRLIDKIPENTDVFLRACADYLSSFVFSARAIVKL